MSQKCHRYYAKHRQTEERLRFLEESLPSDDWSDMMKQYSPLSFNINRFIFAISFFLFIFCRQEVAAIDYIAGWNEGKEKEGAACMAPA